MSDLISRSELLSTISNMNFDFGNDTDDTETIIEMVSEVIKEQLIAYSVDKVVEELQEFLINYGVSEKSNVHQRIIEIVKQGGRVDE